MAEYDLRAAKRYATALFAFAQRQNKLEAVEQDLAQIAELMTQSPKLREFWESAVVPAGKKRELVSRVLGDSVDPVTLSFLRLLVDKRREEVLEPVREEMGRLADVARHLVRAEAIFAVTPTAEETAELVRGLEQRTGLHIEIAVSVDPDILGGIVVRMNDSIIDGSVRGNLERMREQLLLEA